jgi:cell division protein ZapA (FtsZ GTPase activity inhibitor)
MAALNLSHELLQAKSGIAAPVASAIDKADLQRLSEKIERALNNH